MNISVAILKADQNFYLMLTGKDEGFCIMAWETPRKALNYFERGYNECHWRNYEASMSACINFILFQPVVVSFSSLEDIKTKLGLSDTIRPHRISNISGSYVVLPLDKSLAEPIYEAGITPRLIKS